MENPTTATAFRAPKLHSKAVLVNDPIAHDRRMKKNRIKTLAGDQVTDLEKGRLIFCHKDERTALVTRQPPRRQFSQR